MENEREKRPKTAMNMTKRRILMLNGWEGETHKEKKVKKRNKARNPPEIVKIISLCNQRQGRAITITAYQPA